MEEVCAAFVENMISATILAMFTQRVVDKCYRGCGDDKRLLQLVDVSDGVYSYMVLYVVRKCNACSFDIDDRLTESHED